ncbi:MAG: YfcE family phosphodiesterase [Candidatus Thorarchaeota archaeon]|nr:YfcE family phosphodiesterase [Candidatus Thorarchaeota archaeon]
MSQLVLVFGDAHIPSRRDSIPESFYDHIEQANYDLALITGDLVRESEMRSALPPLPRSFIVVGNMDYGSQYNFHEQIQLDDFNVLLLHGTQLRPRGNIKQLWEITQEIGAHVAIHGHSHTASIDLHKDRLLLNPGTISGATGGWGDKIDASFIELEVSKTELLVKLFLTDWKVVKESTLRFQKQEDKVVRL